jgi:hypothetical protein
MQCTGQIVTAAMLFWFVSAPICLGQSNKVLSGRDLLRALRDKNDNEKLDEIPSKETPSSVIIPDLTKKTASQSRVLHFPKDRSLGKIMVQAADISRRPQTFRRDSTSRFAEGEYLCEAQGDVMVVAGKRVGLVVNEAAGQDLSALTRLKPNDLYYLMLAGSVNNSSMPYITNLTGLRVLYLAGNINDSGMRNINRLQSLERLTLSEGL